MIDASSRVRRSIKLRIRVLVAVLHPLVLYCGIYGVSTICQNSCTFTCILNKILKLEGANLPPRKAHAKQMPRESKMTQRRFPYQDTTALDFLSSDARRLIKGEANACPFNCRSACLSRNDIGNAHTQAQRVLPLSESRSKSCHTAVSLVDGGVNFPGEIGTVYPVSVSVSCCTVFSSACCDGR
jgi:hypothetical protein